MARGTKGWREPKSRRLAGMGTISREKNQRSVKNKWIDYFSRKFILALVSLGLGFYLAIIHSDMVNSFIGLVSVILGFYNGANVLQSRIETKREVQGGIETEETTSKRLETTRRVSS